MIAHFLSSANLIFLQICAFKVPKYAFGRFKWQKYPPNIYEIRLSCPQSIDYSGTPSLHHSITPSPHNSAETLKFCFLLLAF